MAGHQGRTDRLLAAAFLVVGMGLCSLSILGTTWLERFAGGLGRVQGIDAGKLSEAFFSGIRARSLPWGIFYAVVGAGILWWKPWVRAHAGGWSLRAEFYSLCGALRAPFKDRKVVWACLGVLLLAALMRLVNLDREVRYDEAYSYLYFSSRSPLVGLSYYGAPNNHLFHTFLVHVATRFFGPGPIPLRLTAFLAGLSVVPLAVIVGSSLLSPGAGLLSALWWAVSPYPIAYSVNARGYTLAVALFLLLSAAAIGWARDAREGQNRQPPILLMSLASALGMYTIPASIFWSLGTCLFLLFRLPPAERRKLAWCVCLTALLVVFLYSPVFVVSGIKPVVSQAVSPLALREVAPRVTALPALLATAWRPAGPHLLAVILSICAGLGFIASFLIKKNRQGAFFFAAQLVAAGLFLALLRKLPFIRVYMYLVPLWYLCGAAPLVLAVGRLPLWGRSLSGVLLAALVVAGGLYEQRQGTVREDPETGYLPSARATAAVLDILAEEGTAVVVPYPPLFEYYTMVDDRRALARGLKEKPAQTDSVLLVTSDARFRYPNAGLVRPRLELGQFSEPRVVARLRGITVSRLERTSR